jgi:hypothetical protein
MAKSSKMKLPINEVLGVVAGAVAAGFVSKLINDKLPNTPGFVKSLIPIGLGVFMAGNKNAIVKGAGFGMVAKGGADLATTLIPGIGEAEDIFMSSPADQSILSLPADQSVLSGEDYEFVGADDDDDDFIGQDDDAFMNGEEEVEI